MLIKLYLSYPGCIVTCMEFMDDSSRARGARVCVTDADVGSLSDAELVERMAELGRERSRVEGQLAVAAAEMHRRVGGRAAAATVRAAPMPWPS